MPGVIAGILIVIVVVAISAALVLTDKRNSTGSADADDK